MHFSDRVYFVFVGDAIRRNDLHAVLEALKEMQRQPDK
jgi:hypothetical protein